MKKIPFQILGYDHSRHFFLTGGKKTLSLNSHEFERGGLLELAPLAWWQRKFPLGDASDYDRLGAYDWVVRQSEQAGLFDPTRIPSLLCGAGPWRMEACTCALDFINDAIDAFAGRAKFKINACQDAVGDDIHLHGAFPAWLAQYLLADGRMCLIDRGGTRSCIAASLTLELAYTGKSISSSKRYLSR